MDEKVAALFDSRNTLFFSWSYSRRSEDIAALLGIPYRFFPLKQQRRLFQFPLLFVRTLFFLAREHPRTLFVQHPPVHILLPVLLYCLLSGARFVIDSHITPGTTLVEKPYHRFYLLLHRFYSYFAAVTLFHSRAILERSKGWSGKRMVLENPVRPLALKSTFAVDRHPAVGMVTSFSPDEHVEAVIEAAVDLSGVSFYITGPEEKIPAVLRKAAPARVLFTGYLSGTTYYEFLHAMDLIVVLTDRPASALLGAYESISAGTPLVVSDTRTMRQVIGRGAVFVENEAEAIRKGIEAALAERERMRYEITQLKQEKLEHQQRAFLLIATILCQSP